MFIRELSDTIIEIMPSASGSPAVLFECDQRAFVKWIKENRMDIIRDIICEDCPKHDVR